MCRNIVAALRHEFIIESVVVELVGTSSYFKINIVIPNWRIIGNKPFYFLHKRVTLMASPGLKNIRIRYLNPIAHEVVTYVSAVGPLVEVIQNCAFYYY